MTYEEYSCHNGITATAIKAGRKSLRHMQLAMTSTTEPTSAMSRGTLLHTVILEHDRYVQNMRVYDGTKRGAAWDAFSAQCPDHDLILKSWEVNDMTMAWDSVMSNTSAKLMLDYMPIREEMLQWTVDGIPWKCKLDAMGSDLLLDIKSAQSVDSRKMGQVFYGMGYDIQMGIYRAGVMSHTTRQPEVYILAIESKPPFDVNLIRVQPEVLDAGWATAQKIAKEWTAWVAGKELVAPGQYPAITELETPAYIGSAPTDASALDMMDASEIE